METTTSGIQPMFDMSRSNDNSTFGTDGWFWIILILLFAGNGWGNNQQPQQLNVDEQFIMRDIFNTNENVSNTAAATQQAIMENRYANQLGDCGITKEVLQNRYDNSLQTNVLQAQMSQGFCDVKASILEQTNNLLNAYKDDKIAALREQLFTATQAYNNQALASNIVSQLQPVAKPAYVVSSPYTANYYPTCNCSNS